MIGQETTFFTTAILEIFENFLKSQFLMFGLVSSSFGFSFFNQIQDSERLFMTNFYLFVKSILGGIYSID
jgi:hypothetical protein